MGTSNSFIGCLPSHTVLLGAPDAIKTIAHLQCSNQRHHQQVQHNEPHGGLRNDDLPLLQEGEVGPTVERNTKRETDSLLIVAGVSLFMRKNTLSPMGKPRMITSQRRASIKNCGTIKLY